MTWRGLTTLTKAGEVTFGRLQNGGSKKLYLFTNDPVYIKSASR